MRELPDEWRRVQLKDCGTWLSGGTPATEEPRFWGGDIPWISAASLKNFSITDSERKVTRLGSMSGTKLVGPGNVLFVVRGMSLKTEFRVGVTQRQVAFGQDCKVIIPSSSIDGTFLALALKACEREVLAMVDEAGHGTGRLPIDLLEKLSIGVPELAEQQQILDVIEAVTSQILAEDRKLTKLRSVRAGLAERSIAELGGVSCEYRTLGDVSHVSSGVTLGSEPSGGSSVELPYLKVANVQAGYIDTSDIKHVRVLRSQVDMYSLKKGDLLLTEGGDWDKLGRGAVWDGSIDPVLYQNHVFRVRCDPRVVLSEYLAMYTASAVGRAYFIGHAKQTSNLATINSTELKSMPILVPPLSIQRRLIESLREVDSYIEAVRRVRHALVEVKEGLVGDLLSGRVRV